MKRAVARTCEPAAGRRTSGGVPLPVVSLLTGRPPRGHRAVCAFTLGRGGLPSPVADQKNRAPSELIMPPMKVILLGHRPGGVLSTLNCALPGLLHGRPFPPAAHADCVRGERGRTRRLVLCSTAHRDIPAQHPGTRLAAPVWTRREIPVLRGAAHRRGNSTTRLGLLHLREAGGAHFRCRRRNARCGKRPSLFPVRRDPRASYGPAWDCSPVSDLPGCRVEPAFR